MNKKPIIGVIGRADIASDDDRVIGVIESVRQAIVKFGGIPTLILPTQDVEYASVKSTEIPSMTTSEKEAIYAMLDKCDGIVMPGGSVWYEYDEVVATYVREQRIPTLGICMGMQIMAKIDHRDRAAIVDDTVRNESEIDHCQPGVSHVHPITIKKGTKLYDIIQVEQIEVNSRHNYHIVDPEEVVVSAVAPDGIIEAIEDANHPFMIGVQWHPESIFDDIASQRLFMAFIEASKHHQKRAITEMKKPLIGMIGRPDETVDHAMIVGMWEDSRRAIIKKGGVPFVLLPNQDLDYEPTRPRDVPPLTTIEREELKRMITMCDGVFIPGGYKWYEFDCQLYEYALEQNLPILGICTGMQMMARIDNQSDQDAFFPNIRNETETNHHQRNVKYVHDVILTEGSLLQQIIGETKISVNSRHNYHIPKVNHFQVAAVSHDELIEGMEATNKKFVIGVQWHPETMLGYDQPANRLLEAFIKACQK